MSFGFGIGDFIAVLQLASEIRQKWIDAPSEYATIRNETGADGLRIKNVESILRDLHYLVDRLSISAPQKDTLADTVASCKVVLTAANAIADAYSTSSSSSSSSSSHRLRRSWRRFRSDPDEVRHVRDQLVSVVARFSVVQNNIQLELDHETLGDIQSLKISDDDEKKSRIADWFAPPVHAVQQTVHLNFREPGTGTWFLQAPRYLAWRDGSRQTLFCPGIAGSGKSVIFATVVNDLQDRFGHSSDIIVVYFYCSYKRQHEQDLSQILAAFVRQLLQRQTSTPDFVKQTYDKYTSRDTRPSAQDLYTLIQSFAGLYRKVFILMDALDECISAGGDSMTLDKLLAYLINLQRESSSDINIMTTSRPGIVTIFDAQPRIEIEARHEDVMQYLTANVTAFVPCVAHSVIYQKKVSESVAGIVDGMFLLARLHLESLRDKTKIRTVLTALESMPRGSGSTALDNVYGDALHRIDQQLAGLKGLALRTLTWMIHTRRELTMDELREAVAIDSDMDDIDHELDLDSEGTITAVCAGLITVDPDSRLVRLTHYTTQIYLQHNLERWMPSGSEYIAKCCTDYLTMKTFYMNGMDWGLDCTDQLRRYALLNYVGCNWGFHVNESTHWQMHVKSILCDRDVHCFASQLALCHDKQGPVLHSVSRQIPSSHLCAYFDSVKAMQCLLDQGQDVNATCSQGKSSLLVASYYGSAQVTNQLLAQRDVNVNLRTEAGRAPISCAIAYGRTDIVEQLLRRQDIDVNTQDEDGTTPLHGAAYVGRVDFCAQLLARQDIIVNVQAESGLTPLYLAAYQGHVEVCAQLLDRQDINVNVQGKDGTTPLHAVAMQNRTRVCARLLARQDIIVNVQEKDGTTPLHWAAYQGHVEICTQLLARQDINVNVQRKGGSTPLHLAAHQGHVEVCAQLLARQDINVNVQEKDGSTPLHWAAGQGHIGVCAQLLARQDINVNVQEKDGSTPLHGAAGQGYIEICAQLLTRQDINVNIPDQDGNMPLSEAVKESHAEISSKLLPRTHIAENTKLSQMLDERGIEWRQSSKKDVIKTESASPCENDSHGPASTV